MVNWTSLGLVAASDPGYDCRPGRECWPSTHEWQQFNASIGGHLYETIPIAAPCYRNSPWYDELACKVVESYYGDSVARGEHFGQTYWLNWETCRDSGCTLLESNPEEKMYATCSIGRLASYYVDVREPSHISAALKFAKSHNIPISIKNTGHDFYGRSSVPNTLAIWTHHLDTLNFYSNFTASNCPSANRQNVGELGAGVIAGDAYRFFNGHGMDIPGGYEQSVGLAGGFGQGEASEVSADEELRVINECNDPELFWAMRGGGGGTYAILTKYRIQVYPSLPIHTYTFTANLTGVDYSSDATKKWQIDHFPEKFTVGLVLVYGDDGSKLKSATASFANFLSNRTDLSVSENNYNYYTNYASYLSVTAADAKVTEPSGIFSLLSSRLIPRKVFTAPESIDELVDGVLHGLAVSRSLLNLTGTQIVPETPVTNLDSNQASSANPAWRDALWHVIHVGEWLEPLEEDVLQKTAVGFLALLEPLKKLSPGGGAYLNEAHYLEPDSQQTYFGSNYARLLEVKNKYDSTHIFDCYKCVGWRGEEDPFYSCYE
ncbi:FAD linked oxidase N-terminal [Penicillium maclennaniae]|uniref:FAD linked oxidase N-terminal n=1 Tax=Penicillium maclennaniae TaxID=1343394 RepID=UPI00254038FE|nr:FAD linked oxidase N-terminal [Penicillium maclennaniae]KAJ5678419.1 FAD linked oxidase N-terminal [Penicillium maclennaniae]